MEKGAKNLKQSTCLFSSFNKLSRVHTKFVYNFIINTDRSVNRVDHFIYTTFSCSYGFTSTAYFFSIAFFFSGKNSYKIPHAAHVYDRGPFLGVTNIMHSILIKSIVISRLIETFRYWAAKWTKSRSNFRLSSGCERLGCQVELNRKFATAKIIGNFLVN